MSRLWKTFKTNWMYWRFRYITRNRMRLQTSWNRRRNRGAGARPYRPLPRASAQFVYSRSPRRTWMVLGTMVAILTVLRVYVNHVYVSPGLVYSVGTLVVVGAAYWALRGI